MPDRQPRPSLLVSWALVASPLALGAALVSASGCHGSARAGGGWGDDRDARPVVPEHESCDISSGSAEKIDSNNDGRPDIITVRSGSHEVCRAEDLNLDGVFDRYIYFDANGRVRRVESDYDRDGKVDEIAIYHAGVLVRKDREMNLDGKLDTWDVYDNGRLVKRERDTLGDGRVHQWWVFTDPSKPACALVTDDLDGDGAPDPGSRFDICNPEGEPASIIATGSSSFNNAAPASPRASSPPAATTVTPLASSLAPPAAPASAAPSASAPARKGPSK